MPKQVPARPRPVAVRNLHPRLRLERAAVVRLLRALDGAQADLATPASTLANPDELSIVFLTDAELARLHAGFLADPSPTDVITFAGRPALGAAGEICVSADAAARYASAHGRDFSAELTLYLVHGWLHLAGHDDRDPRAKRAMRRAEARALALLREQGPLPRFGFSAAKQSVSFR
jgi:probable rRNA maturation factor